jgi:hypothetical protein
MAKQSGLGNQFYYAGYDLSGDVASLDSISSPRPALDVTSVSQSAIDRVLGLSTGIISFTTHFNDAALQEHVALSALATTDKVAIYSVGETANDTAAGLEAKQLNYDMTRGADGAISIACEVQGSAGNPIEWGNILTTGVQTVSSAASTSSIDQGASTSQGARAYIMNFTLSSGSPTVKIEDSPNDSSWSDLITFTGSSAATAERKTVTGTINRYVRCTLTGTFSNLAFAVVLVRGTSVDDVSLAS